MARQPRSPIDSPTPDLWQDGPSKRRGSERAGDTAADAARSSYYGVPVIHKPHWKWLIVVYFFLGGIAGGAYLLAAIAGAVHRRGNRPIVRAGRYLSFAAMVPSPLLLILDLGRPERFFMMLRVLKFRSPMSVGTWALTAFGAFSAFAAAAQAADDGLFGSFGRRRAPSARLTQAAAAVGTPFALVVAGYTGVLLAATAVPLWTKRALLLGPLFLASAMSTAASAVSLALGASRGPIHRLERLESVFTLVELAVFSAWLRGLGATAGPLVAGRTGWVMRVGVLYSGLVLPLVVRWLASLVSERQSKQHELTGYVASGAALGGGFALRYVVVVAGNASADDPQATLDLTVAPPSMTRPTK